MDGSINTKQSGSSAALNKSRQNSASHDAALSPKMLTSFPSFSPPPVGGPRRKRSSKGSRAASGVSDVSGDGPRSSHKSISSDVSSRSPTTASLEGSSGVDPKIAANHSQKPSISIASRTWKGAANLHKSLITSLTRSAGDESAKESVFEELDWEVSDPLEPASDEQIQRVIDRNGGAIPSLRQFSKDLAESNGRVAEERNKKLELVDRNRALRDENDQLKLQLEEMQRKYKNVQNLFKRYVRPDYPAQIQIVDSPNGHYILDTTTGELIETLKPVQKSTAALQKVPSSTSLSTLSEEQPKTTKQDAVTSLKQLAPRRKTVSEGQKSSGKDARKSRDSISVARPDSLELRSPVALESLPPALRGTTAASDNAPVDRLGFFFTASRETRHQEALAYHPKGESSETSSVNSFPYSDDDHDASLKTPGSHDDSSSFNVEGGTSSAAELLSYAPVGPALRFVSTPEHGVRMFIDVSSPSTPTTDIVVAIPESSAQSAAALAQTSAAGTMITPTRNSSNSNTNALDALLDKLNEAHDKQQEKRVRDWNAFHDHLKSNIPKGLSRASSDYGMASISRLCSKGIVSAETLKKFNNLILSGIPVALRREVWLERTGASVLIEPGRFANLLATASLDDFTRHEISIDVERTMGNNIFFRNGVGKTKLTDVLVAYAEYNPEIGYSQGLNIIAGNLLLMLPGAEETFWLLVAIIENILPSTYYSQDGRISATALSTDSQILSSYIPDLLGSALHKHFLIHNIDLTMFTPGWFISGFAACLSGEPLFRLWDIIFGFCDGRYVFCFALALLKINRRGLLDCESEGELMGYLAGRMSGAAVGVDVLVKEAVRIGGSVTAADLEKRRAMFS